MERLIPLAAFLLLMSLNCRGSNSYSWVNYVRTITPLDSTSNLSNPSCYTSTFEITDGFGRKVSTVMPQFTATGGTVSDFIGYDRRGRIKKRYCLSPLGILNGMGLALSESSFAMVAESELNDNAPYTEITYDPLSPQNPETIIGAGQSWHTAQKSVHNGTTFNNNNVLYTIDGCDLNAVSLACRLMTVGSGGELRIANNVYDGYYADGTLRVDVTVDEDGKSLLVFSDRDGRKVLERRLHDDGTEVDTHWVYDRAGRLTYVVPPKASSQLSQVGACDTAIVNSLCYRYSYDSRNRIIEKKLPGNEPIYYVYDKLNRVVMSQDGCQRALNRWTVIKRDSHGRQVVRGTATIGSQSREQLQTTWGSRLMVESYDDNIDMEFNFKYTDTCGLTISPEMAYYYDNYDFWENYIPMPTDPDFANCTSVSATGMLTGTATTNYTGAVTVKALVTDIRGNLVLSAERDVYADSYLYCEFRSYDFRNRLTSKRRRYNTVATGEIIDAVTDISYYSYDNRDRLTEVRHRTGSGPTVTTAQYSYDSRGRLSQVTLGNGEVITYNRNIRDWLTKVQASTFTQDLYYENAFTNSTPSYSGKISALTETRITDNSMTPSTQSRRFLYDNLGRLCYSLDSGPGTFNEQVNYDLNGNITALTRGDVVYDQLKLQYSGNRLTTVFDSTYNDALQYISSPQVKKNHSGYDLSYDACGRLTKDESQGLERIDYNTEGNPVYMVIDDDHQIGFTYRSDGTKESESQRRYYITIIKRVDRITGDTIEITRRTGHTDVTRYHGDYVMRTGMPIRIYTNVGFVDCHSADSANYYYTVRDYQGSVRRVLDRAGNIVQATDYLASGVPVTAVQQLDVDRRKYTGYELLSFAGVTLYDSRARWYNPLVPRFNAPDNLAESTPQVTPYAYCAADPVNHIDPTGNDEWEINEKGQVSEPIKNNVHDAFYIVDSNGKRIPGKELILDYGTVISFAKESLVNPKTNAYYLYKLIDDAAGTAMFEFVSNNTGVEWSQFKTGTGDYNDLNYNYITCSLISDNEPGGVDFSFTKNSFQNTKLRAHIHNHPNGNEEPSGKYNYDDGGDLKYAKNLEEKLGYRVDFSIYVPQTSKYYPYDSHSYAPSALDNFIGF